MLVPKRTITALRTSRCLSTTAARPWATPTGRYPNPAASDTTTTGAPARPGGTNPVDDIDVVFDFPSEAQGRYEKQPLEQSGLDLHSAMPHHPPPAPGMMGKNMPGGGPAKMGKEMGYMENSMYRYIGLGAIGLGGLYMMMRPRKTVPMTTEPGVDARNRPPQPSAR